MVDMIEARKRAKSKLEKRKTETFTPEAQPPEAKPVLRAETPSVSAEEISHFPVSAPAPRIMPPATPVISVPQPAPIEPLPQRIPATIYEEDQVDFLQRLFADQEHDDEEDEEAGSEEEASEDHLEVLIFQLGNERYGMDIQQISEIIRFVEPTEVPNTIAFLDGIISLRGRMIPVINGRTRLGHTPQPADKKTRIIILNENGEYHGILVDTASQVVKLSRKEIEPTPSVVVGVDAEFIEGVCDHKKQLIILLNLERFLQYT